MGAAAGRARSHDRGRRDLLLGVDQARHRGLRHRIRAFLHRWEEQSGEAGLSVLVAKAFRMHRVVITGMGWVTPMGHSIDAVWKRLLNGESGIARTTIFEASTFPTTFSAEVKDYDLAKDLNGEAGRHSTAGRNTRFAL